VAADASQVAPSAALHTSSGDTAAFPSLGVTLLKLGILLMLLASLAGGAVLAYKTGASQTLALRFALARHAACASHEQPSFVCCGASAVHAQLRSDCAPESG